MIAALTLEAIATQFGLTQRWTYDILSGRSFEAGYSQQSDTCRYRLNRDDDDFEGRTSARSKTCFIYCFTNRRN